MRNAFADAFYEMAKADDRVCMVVADITASAGVSEFRREFPERFVNVGVAEQIMVGMCAGMALRGYIPFTYTIATFTAYRPFEQVRLDCCYQDLPVRLVGVGAGLTYASLGGTHHAQEDLAVLGAIPNMTLLTPCDPSETTAITHATKDISGPAYLRLGKAGEPDLTADAAEPFTFGKVRFFKTGSDVCILGCGPVVHKALAAAKIAKAEHGIDPAVATIHCVKPLDKEGIVQRLFGKFSRVVVLEEHAPIGGLSSRVKDLACDSMTTTRIRSVTLQDEFIHAYSSHDELQDIHGLSVENLVRATVED